MDARDFVLPAAVFIGGAVLGRLFGLRPIWRGAMAAFALAQASKGAGLIETPGPARRKPRRKAVAHAARKRPVHKKSTHSASVAS